MPADDTRLRELAEQLLACGDPALLDAPLDRVGHPEALDLLRELYEAGDARSLRELLAQGALERWTSSVATPSERETLRAQIARWLGTGQAGDDDPARLAQIEPLPRDLEGLLAWARPYGVLGELSRPAHEVLRDASALPARTTVIECCLGVISDLAPGASLLAAHRAEDEAREHLTREAAAHASLAAREALWRAVIGEEPLRRLAERLRAVVAGTDVPTLASLRFVPARPVSVDAATGIARGVLAGAEPITARLFLSGHEQRAIEGACDRCARPSCLHVRALAARLLDACHDPGDRLHAALRELTAVPSWKRFLHALAPELESSASASQRIAFRIRIDGDRALVGAVLQSRAPDRWSAGRLASPLELARSPAITERDRAVLDVLALGARTRSAQMIAADPTLLRALVEHPLVHVEGTGAPIRVCEESVHVELAELPDGLAPRVSLAGARVEPGARGRDAYLLHHDRERGTLTFAPLTPSVRRLLGALATFRGVLPPESYPRLAPWLAQLAQVARVSAPSVLRGTERPASEKLLLRIAPAHDEGIDLTLSTRPLPLGPLWSPGLGPELCHGLEDGVPVFARRDLARESAIAAEVIAALELDRHLRLEPFAYRIEGNQAALEVLSAAARLSDRVAIEWADRARRLGIIATSRASDLAIDLRKKGAWLGVEGVARAGGADIALGRLLDAARRGERFVAIEGGDHVEIERALFERLQRASLVMTESAREPAMSLAAAPFVLDTLGDAEVSADAPTREWLERARGAAEPVALDPVWSARLREYQRAGVSWLIERSRWAPGVCLADEMGLGKTVQAIALLDARRELGPALVVAPTSVVDNWARELARFAPSLEVRVHREARNELELGPGAVLITSFDLLLRDAARFAGARFATQVVDEAQMVKNARTQRARAVAGIDAAFRVALTGTPVENRLGDLWSLFHLIAPGLLGSWARFRGRFAVPIERYQDEARAALLRSVVAPFVLRRTKRDVAPELPSRTEVVHRVELSTAEQDLYAAARRKAQRALSKARRADGESRTVQILAELTRLRQLACHPRLVVEDDRVESSKLHALLRLLDDVLPRGHRVLVFSQFTRHLALVRAAIEARGTPCLYLDGATPASERARLVDRFQRLEAPVFLVSLKAGGTGLNLTAADYVVHMDPWWNPAAEDQASDRAHRIGQERPVTIVRLVAQDTIEERVLALHEGKRALAGAVVGDASTPLDVATLESLVAG